MPDLTAVARRFGTPLYVYDAERLRATAQGLMQQLAAPLGASLHYAVKANSNPTLLGLIRAAGLHADAVSEGEVQTALACGWPAAAISCTANNASDAELDRVHARGAGIVLDALDTLDRFGARHPGARVGLRVNPGVGEGHHPHVITGGPASKFGLLGEELADARDIAARRGIEIIGLQQHIGSGILEPAPMVHAVDLLLDAARPFPDLRFLDFGGGLGIPYRDGEQAFDLTALAAALGPRLQAERDRRRDPKLEFRFEPGRSVVGPSGTLLVEVTAVKPRADRQIVGVDSGFGHLLRPILYNAHHRIRNLTNPDGEEAVQDVAGNICESGDLFARARALPRSRVGDLLAIEDAGAYGWSMASPYNLRGRPAEALLEGDSSRLIRRPEGLLDLWRGTDLDPAAATPSEA